MSMKQMSDSTLTDTGRSAEMSMGVRPWGTASGGTEVTSGGYKYHVFTTIGSSTLTVLTGGNFEFLAIAGGGGGQSGSGRGGGAGGVVSGTMSKDPGSVDIYVGDGGIRGKGRGTFTSYSTDSGRQGFPSLIGDDIVAVGGGAGGKTVNGGSGGGTGISFGPQGSDGGPTSQSGGGGAGEVGDTIDDAHGGTGTSNFSDWAVATSTGENDGNGVWYYAGGGAGQWRSGSEGNGSKGTGGLGGGGNSGGWTTDGDAGTDGTGGGGGAGRTDNENRIMSGGNGGSGIVIVRYQI